MNGIAGLFEETKSRKHVDIELVSLRVIRDVSSRDNRGKEEFRCVEYIEALLVLQALLRKPIIL